MCTNAAVGAATAADATIKMIRKCREKYGDQIKAKTHSTLNSMKLYALPIIYLECIFILLFNFEPRNQVLVYYQLRSTFIECINSNVACNENTFNRNAVNIIKTYVQVQ